MRTLVLGGIRSGKSRWAEAAIAESLAAGQPVHYLATGPGRRRRSGLVAADRRASRPPAARIGRRSETDDIATQLRQSPDTPTLVDDIGGWLTATLDRRQAWEGGSVAADVDDMLAAVAEFSSPLVLVSPEVGLTVVPATESAAGSPTSWARSTSDWPLLCDRVVLVVAGHPLPIKPPRN